NVSLRLSVGEAAQTSRIETLWRFATRDRTWAVVLGEAALTLEVPGYTTIDEFSDRFSSVLKLAREQLRIVERTRLGLRYINEVRHPHARNLGDWGTLLRREFVGFAASDLLGGAVDQSRHELRVQQPDGVMVVRHGLV